MVMEKIKNCEVYAIKTIKRFEAIKNMDYEHLAVLFTGLDFEYFGQNPDACLEWLNEEIEERVHIGHADEFGTVFLERFDI